MRILLRSCFGSQHSVDLLSARENEVRLRDRTAALEGTGNPIRRCEASLYSTRLRSTMWRASSIRMASRAERGSKRYRTCPARPCIPGRSEVLPMPFGPSTSADRCPHLSAGGQTALLSSSLPHADRSRRGDADGPMLLWQRSVKRSLECFVAGGMGSKGHERLDRRSYSMPASTEGGAPCLCPCRNAPRTT